MKPTFFSGLTPEFKEFLSTGIPILNYHMVAPIPFDRKLKGLYIPPRPFSRQLKELKENGYEAISLSEMNDSFGKKTFIISFDDAYVSVLENALKPLEECGFKAIQFVVPNCVGKSNLWDLSLGERQLPIMDKAMIKDWLAAGHEIGSHTLSHPYLSRTPSDKAREEIVSSKKILEDWFGIPIRHFCYPYGDYNRPVRDMVEEAGYVTSSTVEFGINTSQVDRYALKRIKGRHPTRKLKSLFSWFSQS